MELTPVESSNIKAIGHDPSTNVLRVQFHSSGTYDFHGVTAEQYQQLMAAESKGQHFQRHIRYHHEFKKL